MAIKINNNTIIDDSRNIASAGVVTATSFVGDLTGNANVGVITATTANVGSGITISSAGVILGTGKTFYGDGSGLTNVSGGSAGIGSTGNVNTIGIVTSLIIDAFIPEDQKVITVNSTISNNQSNISFAEDLVIGAGVTFTVSTGTTVRMDAFNVINSSSVTSVAMSASTLTVSTGLNTPSGVSSARPSAPATGSIRWNSEYGTLEVYDGTFWYAITLGNPLLDPSSARGIFGGGYISPATNILEYITIATTGNATDFGDLTQARRDLAACASITRGVWGGGYAPGHVNTIDYVTIATTGNAADFGDLTQSRRELAGCSSGTRGLFGGGFVPGSVNTIDFITIASTGNATDFGDLTVARRGLGACSSSTRGVFGGGYVPSGTNTIDYVTIATTGNATDFGDLTVARIALSACSSSTRGVFGGGYSPGANVLDYITIASTGNATDFGDLTQGRNYSGACSNLTRGVWGGGYVPGNSNVIDYITIASVGNATDFGDLTQARRRLAACSNNHGGLS